MYVEDIGNQEKALKKTGKNVMQESFIWEESFELAKQIRLFMI